jgi:hypothetical protein
MAQFKIANKTTTAFPRPSRWPFSLLALGLVVLVSLSHRALTAGLQSESQSLIRDDAQDLIAAYQRELNELAAWCDQRGLEVEARKTRSWFGSTDPSKLYVIELPTKIGDENVPEGISPDASEWHRQFSRLKRDQANSLYELARKAIKAQQASLAFDLVMAALRENSDHDAIRRLLGYQSYRGEWHTSYEVERLRKGQVWDDRYGWLPKTHVPRYEAGERYFRGRWISAEEDARLHTDIRSGWDIETEHYMVRTNHSIEAGVRLADRLEQLYRVWKQLFIRYYATAEQVRALFDGRARTGRIRRPITKHKVVYFRNREEYNQALRGTFPNIEISIGIYVDSTECAYFFAGDEYNERTLLHEATHQLFHESRPVAPSVGRNDNFWIVEGVAMYMESLHTENGYHVLGGFEDDRIVAAQYRLLNNDFYVPLSEFTDFGMEQLQTDPRIRTLYSQAAGLTHFLVHHDGGGYRDALVAYLVAVYSGRDDRSTLSRLTARSYAELDQDYREYMRSAAAIEH